MSASSSNFRNVSLQSTIDRPFSRSEKKTEMKIEAKQNVGGLYL